MTSPLCARAWENYSRTPGWERRWNDCRFDVFVTIAKSDIGEPFPLSINRAPWTRSDDCPGWNIPDRYETIGVYIGRLIVYRGQKRPKMTFATPTLDGNYGISVAHSGIIDWFGGGDDEPCEQSGIRVDRLWITSPKNTGQINKRFGDKIKELAALAA